MRVISLHRYPVKSMAGEALEMARIEANGIAGDRAWAVKDEERGGIRGGKRFPALMQCAAQFEAEPSADHPSPAARITLPDGRQTRTADRDVNEVLSKAIDAPVSLWPLLPADQLDHYRRGAPEPGLDMETYLRQVFARTPDEPLPDVSAFPPELMEFESPPGTYFDAYPILVLSTNTLSALQASSASSRFDPRRFRANILFEAEGEGYVENDWAGRSARVGTAVLRFELVCPRCVMTTHGFDDLPKDPQVMRTLVQQNQGNAGMYATVTQPGEARPGDPIELL